MATLLLIAWQGVRRRVLRNLLTALSLFVAVCAIVMVDSSAEIMEDTIKLDALLGGGKPSTVAVSFSTEAARMPVIDEWESLLAGSFGDVSHAIASEVMPPFSTVDFGDTSSEHVIVTDPQIRAIKPFPILEGRWFSEQSQLTPEIVVNVAARQKMAAPTEFATIRWHPNEQPVRGRIVGVIYDASHAPTAYVRMKDAPAWIVQPGSHLLFVHSPSVSSEQLRGAVLGLAVVSGRQNEIGDVQRSDHVDDVGREIAVARRIFVAIAAVSLFVASLSILNIGLATVQERSREFLLRLGFGATPLEASLVMMLEAQIVAVLASVLAISVIFGVQPFAFGFLTDRYAADAVQAFPLEAAALGIAASCLAALVGSLAPTIRAARATIGSATRE